MLFTQSRCLRSFMSVFQTLLMYIHLQSYLVLCYKALDNLCLCLLFSVTSSSTDITTRHGFSHYTQPSVGSRSFPSIHPQPSQLFFYIIFPPPIWSSMRGAWDHSNNLVFCPSFARHVVYSFTSLNFDKIDYIPSFCKCIQVNICLPLQHTRTICRNIPQIRGSLC